MILKFLAAVLAFFLILIGLHYADPNMEDIIRALIAIAGAVIAFIYTPARA